MNEQYKDASENKLEGSHKSPAMAEPSPTPPSSEPRTRAFLSKGSDGRVTLTFPSSDTWNAQYQGLSPQPARYEPVTPASEISIGKNSQPNQERPVPLRLVTDESLAAVLDSSNPEPGKHSNPVGGDLEAWIESSRQTIIQQNDQRQYPPPEDET